MNDDLVKRLREYPLRECREAADRIKKLEAAPARIAKHDLQAVAMDALRPGERIRKALEGKDGA